MKITKLVACLGLICTPLFAADNGTWKDRVYYDSANGFWVFQVTSTVPRRLDCYATWNGTKTGFNYQGGGSSVNGVARVLLSPYPGVGAPITGRDIIKNVAGLTATVTCTQK